jgi:hypothetical protein
MFIFITLLFLSAITIYYFFNSERDKRIEQELELKLELEEEIKLKNRFSCNICGTIVSENICPKCENKVTYEKKKGSAVWWYLLSFIFGLLGGIIGYVALRQENPGAASNCLVALMMGFI